MLTQHRKPISLSLMSYDLPLWSVVETDATLYQKDQERFHVLLTEPLIQDFSAEVFDPHVDQFDQVDQFNQADQGNHAEQTVRNQDIRDQPSSNSSNPSGVSATPRLLWLEISPYRVIMTMQGNGRFSYRHFWEQGVYGVSRYWLQTDSLTSSHQMRLRNFTRSLTLQGSPFPQRLRVEYELWSQQIRVGHYVMNLEILPDD